MQRVFDSFEEQLRLADDRYLALFLLDALVGLTRGYRKARDLAPLFRDLVYVALAHAP